MGFGQKLKKLTPAKNYIIGKSISRGAEQCKFQLLHDDLCCVCVCAGRFIRRLEQESRESEMEERLVTSERERVLREKQLQQEERLAKVG